ncbi:hypothetical protein [Virgisporangium ochraceum]|nr:hypothetical protein [Virgisporangium ochraceum]
MRPSSKRRWSRTLAGAGLAAVAALTVVSAPTAAYADIQPCDPFDIDCNPLEYTPPRYDAIGSDRDLDRARREAEAEAAAHCPGHSYDVVRVRVTYDDGVWRYTLTYHCD